MPTLQDLVRAQGTEARLPPPTVPVPAEATVGGAILPEANLETPASATQAIEQLARQRYGDNFVEQYGDLMGFRPTGMTDRLRNIAEIMTTRDPGAVRKLELTGVQARADLEQSMVEEATRKRKELFEVYSFIPKGLKAKMSPKTVLQLFSEQFQAVTGEEAHPGIIQALTDMETKGETPVQEVLDGLADGTLSAQDATAMGVDVSTALNFISGYENRKLRKQEIDQRAGRLGDSAVRASDRRKRLKLQEKGARIRNRNALFNTFSASRLPVGQALAAANRQAGLPPPTAEDLSLLGGAAPATGGLPAGSPGIPQAGAGASGNRIVVP